MMAWLHLWGPAILMLILLALAVPITWSLTLAAAAFFLLNGDVIPLTTFAQQLSEGAGSVSLLALPLFVLAGCIMNAAGITRRLMGLAEVMVGHLTGALAQMCTVLGTFLGGLTASANADAAMLAKTIGQEMARHGYARPFAAVITASAAIITALLPPSIGLIIYGFLTESSIGRLFAAGIVPGLLLAAGLMATTYVVARRRGYRPQRARRATWKEGRVALRDGLLALSVPVVIFAGTRYGLFTVTESGAIIVLYVLLIALFGYREMRLRDLPNLLAEAVRDASTVMMMICAAAAFGFYLTWEQAPQSLAGWLTQSADNPWMLLLLINLTLLLLGMIIEGSAALIILTPMLLPVIESAGIDKIQFGIVIITNLTIGGITPPVGSLMYIASQTLRVRMGEFAVEVVPYLAMMMGLLAVLSLFPQVSLWLPDLIYGKAGSSL